jgi:multiple sugar transport system substrate-binding protein
MSEQNAALKGMTWKHHRGYAPMVATAAQFGRDNPGVSIGWDQRSLQDFESQPLEELASTYDLIVIDYPHIGSAVRAGLLLPLDEYDAGGYLDIQRRHSVGPSHDSYRLDGHQWALAIDAAAPVSIHRAGTLRDLPTHWEEVIELSRSGRVLIPLRAPHALIALIWIANNHGFAVAETRDTFMEQHHLRHSLQQLKRVVDNVDRACFERDPIAVQDAMSAGEDAPDYCPFSYGYVSYACAGFRPVRLNYGNTPEVGTRKSAGSVLGGTGIAVSALSRHAELAIKYAFWVTSAQIQCGLYFDSGGQPGLGLAWESDHCNAMTGNFFRNTRATLEGAWLRPNYVGFLNFQETGSRAVSAYLKGERDIAAAVELIGNSYRSSFA